MSVPLDRLVKSLSRTGMTRFFLNLFDEFPDLLMKDMTVEAVRPGRSIKIAGRWVENFGSDSFLGLDQDRRVQKAIKRGTRTWGTHNGTSRAFSKVLPQLEAEQKIAAWMKTEASLIFPSVSLTNMGVLPALVTRNDVIVGDQFAHNSIEEGMKIAKARGVRTAKFAHNNVADLARVLEELRPYHHAVIAIDGVYSMSGVLPPLREFQNVALQNNAILYVDDAHGTGVLGKRGQGTVRDALGNYENTLVVGSLSKAFSCLGGFIACSAAAQEVIKLRSNPIIFGGPVPPPYLEAICAVLDILNAPEYEHIRAQLDANVRQLRSGVNKLRLMAIGGLVPILSVLVGSEENTMAAGRILFERGYYVQSVIFPAVPHGAGVLRIQINANHSPAAIDGLLAALAELQQELPLPNSDDSDVIPMPVMPAEIEVESIVA
jgi:7-keto-8-aminopelargonate synthetase-like enzyme